MSLNLDISVTHGGIFARLGCAGGIEAIFVAVAGIARAGAMIVVVVQAVLGITIFFLFSSIHIDIILRFALPAHISIVIFTKSFIFVRIRVFLRIEFDFTLIL